MSSLALHSPYPSSPLRWVVDATITGSTPKQLDSDATSPTHLPWYSPSDIGENLNIAPSSKGVPIGLLTRDGVPFFPAHSTLVVGIGDVGRVAHLGHMATGNQQITCVVPGKRLVPRFLSWSLLALRDELRAASPSTVLPILNNDRLKSLRICVPSISQQCAITNYLDAETARIDALIEKKQRMVRLLEERFAGSVYDAVSRGVDGARSLKPSSLSWIDAIPNDWDTPTVAMNFSVQLGKMLNPESAFGAEPYPYLRNTNVQWDEFDLEDLALMHFDAAGRSRYELRVGDLLVCEGGEVGRAAVWGGQLPEVYFQKAIHRIRPLRIASTRYLMYCLMAAAKQSVFAVEGNLSTIVHLTAEQLSAHRFPWPPPDEQKRIVAHLDEAYRRSGATRIPLRKQLHLLRERRQALITAAVTGELDSAVFAT